MRQLKIILFKTFILNIGNGFIDKGAKICIKRALPNAQIFEVSGFPNYIQYYKSLGIKNHLLKALGIHRFKEEQYISTQQFTVNITDFIDDVDIVIFPGCILDDTLFLYFPILKKLQERKIPIIFLGAGGIDYSKSTQKKVIRILTQLKPEVLISRDKIAYNLYSKYFKYAYSGIDCGFFINEYYTPPVSNNPFIVTTFDSSEEPIIITNYPIVHAYHEPFNYTYLQNIASRIVLELLDNILRTNIIRISKKKNILISDTITDYLFLYYNAKEVHSDRVHACVAALSYGNRARLYSKTPRAPIFDRILDKDITKENVVVEKEKLDEEKFKQIDALKVALENFVLS